MRVALLVRAIVGRRRIQRFVIRLLFAAQVPIEKRGEILLGLPPCRTSLGLSEREFHPPDRRLDAVQLVERVEFRRQRVGRGPNPKLRLGLLHRRHRGGQRIPLRLRPSPLQHLRRGAEGPLPQLALRVGERREIVPYGR